MKRRIFIQDGLAILAGAGVSFISFSVVAEIQVAPGLAKRKAGDELILYSNTDGKKDSLARLTEGLRLSVLEGKVFKIDEDVEISGTIQVPALARIEGGDKWIVQDKALTPLFVCDGPGIRTFTGINARGVGSDYVNNSSVYAAAAITAKNGATVAVENSRLLNFAGAGVRLMANAVNCKIVRCKITGPGPRYVPMKIGNYGACIVVDNGVRQWILDENDLSLSAQGVVTGDGLADVQITRNNIHDIAGQHGAYIESVRSINISENVFSNIPLQGMKIQIGSTRAGDAEKILINNNKISHVGSHGILFTNPVGGSARIQDFVIKGNKFEEIGESAISLNTCSNGLIESNEVRLAERGLYINSCRALRVSENNIRKVSKEGVLGVNLRDSSFVRNSFYNEPANSNASLPGVGFSGTSTAGIELFNNTVQGTVLRKFSAGRVDLSQFNLRGNNFDFSEIERSKK